MTSRSGRADSDSSVDPFEFREAMSRLAAGVSIVACRDGDGEPRGMTATAVCSVSLRPPLVLASLSHATATHDSLSETGAFSLNFLGRGEENLARRFAGPATGKFDGVAWQPGAATGCPTFPNALAVCECLLDNVVRAGDHTLFIGRVISVRVNRAVANDPLIYFRGAYDALSGPDVE